MDELAKKLKVEPEIVKILFKHKNKSILKNSSTFNVVAASYNSTDKNLTTTNAQINAQNNAKVIKKFRTSNNLAPGAALSLLTGCNSNSNTNNSSFLDDNSLLSSQSSTPDLDIVQKTSSTAQTTLQKPIQNKHLTNLNPTSSNKNINNITPVKQTSNILKADQIHEKFFKGQSPHGSSISLSSPSAAILFGMNSNSFSVPNETPHKSHNPISKLALQDIKETKSPIEKSFTNPEANNQNCSNLTSALNSPSKDKENKLNQQNTSFNVNTTNSNIDELILDAFMNDFSYEIAGSK
jgi:hypothetical protein